MSTVRLLLGRIAAQEPIGAAAGPLSLMAAPDSPPSAPPSPPAPESGFVTPPPSRPASRRHRQDAETLWPFITQLRVTGDKLTHAVELLAFTVVWDGVDDVKDCSLLRDFNTYQYSDIKGQRGANRPHVNDQFRAWWVTSDACLLTCLPGRPCLRATSMVVVELPSLGTLGLSCSERFCSALDLSLCFLRRSLQAGRRRPGSVTLALGGLAWRGNRAGSRLRGRSQHPRVRGDSTGVSGWDRSRVLFPRGGMHLCAQRYGEDGAAVYAFDPVHHIRATTQLDLALRGGLG